MGSLDVQQEWHPQPTYHLKAPQGWINDPCAPGYDSETNTYHLFYQWNPKSCDWGNICWGHFTSKDGIHWQHNGNDPILEPSLPYDKDGIFTGCMYTTGPHGEKGQLTVIYSSIQHLPIHWTIPYTRNCAGLSIATSTDGGRSWAKSPLNPILQGEREDLAVTGFRDPYLAGWEAMDHLRGERSLYGIVSGGVVGKGPNAFVYAVSPTDLTRWTYLGPLCDTQVGPRRARHAGHWNIDFGINWECVNFMTLSDEEQTNEFLIMGAEGRQKPHVGPNDNDTYGAWALWLGGRLRQTEGGPRMEPEFHGLLDNGNFYAANSYEHPKTGQRVVWGWIKEDELTLARRESKGWTGYLSIPREAFLVTRHNVLRALRTPLHDIPSLKVTEAGNGTNSIQTLGIKPLPSHAILRGSKPRIWTNIDGAHEIGHLTTTTSTAWELEAIIKVQDGQQRVGFHIHHDETMSQRTSISFSPDSEELSVDRSRSNAISDIQKETLSGPFTLFVCDEGGTEVEEKLHLRVFADGDVLEVFANDRFALSTVVYTGRNRNLGISWHLEGKQSEGVVFESISLWEHLGSVQSDRLQHRL